VPVNLGSSVRAAARTSVGKGGVHRASTVGLTFGAPISLFFDNLRWTDNGGNSYTRAAADWSGIGIPNIAGTVGKTYRVQFTVGTLTAGNNMYVFRRSADDTTNEAVIQQPLVQGQTYTFDIVPVFKGPDFNQMVWIDDNLFVGTLTNFTIRESL